MKSGSFSPLVLFTVLTFLASCSSSPDTVQSDRSSPKNESAVITPSESQTLAPIENTPIKSDGVTKTGQISYGVPEGHTVTTSFSATVTDGMISSASISMVSGDHESRQYHNRLARNIEAVVVGKKISELSLHAIGGASLTTGAFEQFLSESF